MRTSIYFMVLICCVLSFIEYTSNDYLEEASKTLIKFLQTVDQGWFRSPFYYIDQITSICFLVFAGYLYLTFNTEDGFVCVSAGYAGAAFSGILKSLFAHPRPLWKYEDIEAVACPKDWGSPSGHSMAAGTPLFVIVLLLVHKGYPKKYVFSVVFCIFVTGITRLYIGAHFFFQIILGFAFSGLLALVLVEAHQRKLFFYHSTGFVLKFHFAMLALVALSIGVNKYQEPNWNKYWTTNFESKCSGSLSNERAQGKALMDSLLWANIAGLVFGRYLLGKTEYYSVSNILAVVAFTGGVYGSIKIDHVYRNDLLMLLFTRYLSGVFLSFGIPKLICYKSRATAI